MITMQQILSRCTREQLEAIHTSSHEIMEHMEFVTNLETLQLASENEQFWKLYTINFLAFSELCARAQGKAERNPYPL